ncbi:MAG: hypothetical protein KJ729_07830 [Euryarchaeota archaeon]|nr:hypothetical protein [Euryarchaeota archaeon]
MKRDYNSTLSIDSRKWGAINEKIMNAQGVYNSDTRTACVFLDTMKTFTVDEGGPCGAGEVVVGVRVIREYHACDSENKYLQERAKHKIIRKNAVQRPEGENEVLKQIISTDWHEFIHHFLHDNKIENNCCADELHEGYNSCGLCRITHRYKNRIKTAPDTPRQYPVVLQGAIL